MVKQQFKTTINGVPVKAIQVIKTGKNLNPKAPERIDHYQLNFYTGDSKELRVFTAYSYTNEEEFTRVAKEYGVDKFGDDGFWYADDGLEFATKV
jgi:hypothetical protein